MIITILIFLAVISLLVLSHEFGHFIFAKMKGIRVEEFAFGFPPRIFGWKFGETLYAFNLLPFGGYVKIYGEDDSGENADSRNFASRSLWDRFLVIFAGVLMNMLLAYGLFVVGHAIGFPKIVSVHVSEIQEHSPAATSGILPGDRIIALSAGSEEQKIANADDVQRFTASHLEEVVAAKLLRNGQEVSVHFVPRANPPEGEGAIGIAMEQELGRESFPVYKALWEGIKTTYLVTVLTAEGLAQFFGSIFGGDKAILEQVVGPVGIAKITGEAGSLGFIYLLQITAMLSVNLAVLNILPIPALDGGRILFLFIEKLKGSPISARVSYAVHAAGFAFLIAIMLFITYRDVVRFF